MRRSGLALALFSAWATGAEGAESWIEVKSPHFTLVSNAGERRARGTVWELEQARAAFAKLWPWAKLASGRPTVVIAARDESTLKRWAPRYWEIKGGIRPVSLSLAGADREYLLLRMDNPSTSDQDVTAYYTLYRAYVSQLLQASLERSLPVWLSIGLAEVYGNTSVTDKEVHVGKFVPWHRRVFNERARRPLSAILAAGRDTALVVKEDDRPLFDAQCWALFHYLLFADRGAHAKRLDSFIQLWLSGRSQEVAWAESLPAVRTVEGLLPGYTEGSLFGYGRLLADVNLERERLPVRPLPPAKAAALRAAVLVGLGRPEEAQAAIQEARTADPRSAASYDAEGLLADREQDRARAAQAYGQAEELGSTNAYSYYRAAQLAWKSQADAESLVVIRRRLERAIERNDLYAPAYSYLAEVMVEQDQAQAALSMAQRALTLEPGNAYHHVALARVLYRLGDTASARAAAKRSLELSVNEHDRSNAQGFLRFMDEDGAFQRQRAAQQATQALVGPCQGSEPAACSRLLPELERACADDQPGACAFAGWIYDEGRGVAKDPARAASLRLRACAGGDKQACMQHAWKQANGEGVAKACEGGEAAACGLTKQMPRQGRSFLHGEDEERRVHPRGASLIAHEHHRGIDRVAPETRAVHGEAARQGFVNLQADL